MKNFGKTIALVGMTTLFASAAIASPQIEAADSSLTSNICVAVASGDKWKLHKQLKASPLDKQFVANEMTCNGLSVADFADQYSANSKGIKKYLNLEADTFAKIDHQR